MGGGAHHFLHVRCARQSYYNHRHGVAGEEGTYDAVVLTVAQTVVLTVAQTVNVFIFLLFHS